MPKIGKSFPSDMKVSREFHHQQSTTGTTAAKNTLDEDAGLSGRNPSLVIDGFSAS